jgi:hypothetical protein
MVSSRLPDHARCFPLFVLKVYLLEPPHSVTVLRGDRIGSCRAAPDGMGRLAVFSSGLGQRHAALGQKSAHDRFSVYPFSKISFLFKFPVNSFKIPKFIMNSIKIIKLQTKFPLNPHE